MKPNTKFQMQGFVLIAFLRNSSVCNKMLESLQKPRLKMACLLQLCIGKLIIAESAQLGGFCEVTTYLSTRKIGLNKISLFVPDPSTISCPSYKLKRGLWAILSLSTRIVDIHRNRVRPLSTGLGPFQHKPRAQPSTSHSVSAIQ